MRPTYPGTPKALRARRRSVAMTVGLRLAAAAFVLLIVAPPARAQAVKKAQATTELDTRPLARFIPGEKLAMIIVSEGLDAHAEAWSKTAAYRMLNETSLGVMLETVAAQLADHALANLPNRKMTGKDLVAVVKHVAHKGFALGLSAPAEEGGTAKMVLVLRGASAREYRGPFARLLGTMMGATKPQLQKKGTRSIVTVADPSPTPDWVWWSEEHDLVLGDLGTDEIVAAVLAGERASAVDHPSRVELTQPVGNFIPLGWLLIDPKVEGASKLGFEAITKQGVEKVDFRWGFSEDALMSMTRLTAPSPRSGALAAFDRSSFGTDALPPLPDGLEAFTAFSIEGGKALDALLSVIDATTRAELEQTIEDLTTKSRLDLRTDLLTQLGPKMVFYLVPGGSGGSGAPLSMGLGSPNILETFKAVASGQMPRAALVAEVKDPVALGKALDTFMVQVNKALKANAAEAAEAAGAQAAAGPGGRVPGGEDPGQSERRRTPPPAMEFRLSPGSGSDKVYTLNVPTALSSKMTAGFRPSIRLSGKYLAIGTAGDVARVALEPKAGAWKPGAELSAALSQLPRAVTALNVDDPRPTLPETLASLPATFQKGFNTAVLLSRGQAPGTGPGGASPPGGIPGEEETPGGGKIRGGILNAGPPPGGSSGGASAPQGGLPGEPGFSAPEPGGQPGGNPGQVAGGPGLLQFQIDPETLPAAEELRSKLFPGVLLVTSDDREIKIVTRDAFPNLSSPANPILLGLALPSLRAASERAAKAAGLSSPPTGAAPGIGTSPSAVPGETAVPPAGYPGGQGGGAPPVGRPQRRP